MSTHKYKEFILRNVRHFITRTFGPRARSQASGRVATFHFVEDSRPYGISGRLSCAPWEGLYLEIDD